MGWSSWNHFHIDIDEKMIQGQADAMVASGMKDAGYSFINIDDGYFGRRDGSGNLLPHPEKFPSGMKNLATYIHSKELKAGIYSDAGDNTCASISQHDKFGKDVGLN
jgi:alpha-galactosidase